MLQLAVFNDEQKNQLRQLTERLRLHKISVESYRKQSRRIIKDVHVLSYTIGHGGRNSMTLSDWGRIGYQLRGQYAYFEHFVSEIDTLTIPQAQARIDLYVDAARASYYRGRGAEARISLPAYPGDGSTICRTGCKCGWRFQFNEDETVFAYWELGVAEHCVDCMDRSQVCSPYVAAS